MATRDSMDQLFQKCEDVMRYVHDQLDEAKLQEHYNDTEFTKAQQKLEEVYVELEHLALSANAQQKEMLNRKRAQLSQLQNEMILEDH